MRTTVRLDEALFVEAKKWAAANGSTLTALIEDALREVLSRKKAVSGPKTKIVLPTFRGKGVRPGVDLESSATLLDVMDENS
jgi:hypothetical protein